MSSSLDRSKLARRIPGCHHLIGAARANPTLTLARLLRSRTFWRVVSVVALCECLAASAWLLFLLNASTSHTLFALALLATQLLALIGFLSGGRAQQQQGWLTWLTGAIEARRAYYEPVSLSGDPTLLHRMSALRPDREFAPLTSPEAMREWRRRIRLQLTETLFRSPFAQSGKAPEIHTLRTVQLGTLSRSLVTFEANDGTAIPGYLFQPDDADRPRPVALVIPGHGRGIVETAGIVKSYQHGVALALARAGFVTLTPELRGFGHLGEVSGAGHTRVAIRALLAGTSYYAVLLDDLRRGLSALLDLPAIDPDRVVVTGCSLGGDLSVTLGALDERVSAVVAQGLCNWHGERGQRPTPEEDGSAFNADICAVVPGDRSGSHLEDRYLLLAPRPFAIVNSMLDVGHMQVGTSWLLSLLESAYHLESVASRFRFILAPGGHEYHIRPAIDFLHEVEMVNKEFASIMPSSLSSLPTKQRLSLG